jgi:hypothetical protein
MRLPVTLKMACRQREEWVEVPARQVQPADCRSFDQLHHQRASGVGIFQTANFGDVGMFKHRHRGRMTGHPKVGAHR